MIFKSVLFSVYEFYREPVTKSYGKLAFFILHRA